jgi:hypothetical protein
MEVIRSVDPLFKLIDYLDSLASESSSFRERLQKRCDDYLKCTQSRKEHNNRVLVNTADEILRECSKILVQKGAVKVFWKRDAVFYDVIASKQGLLVNETLKAGSSVRLNDAEITIDNIWLPVEHYNIVWAECIATFFEINVFKFSDESFLHLISPRDEDPNTWGGLVKKLRTCAYEKASGHVLSLAGSFVNHSCVPNAVAKVEDNVLVLTALVDIAAKDPISISYERFGGDCIDARRSFLHSRYRFVCECDFCKRGNDAATYVGALPSSFCTDACSWCGFVSTNLKSCAKCKRVVYCGRICQISHWKFYHSSRCKNVES